MGCSSPCWSSSRAKVPEFTDFSAAALLLLFLSPYPNLIIPTLPPERIKMAVLNTTFISLHLIAYFHPLKKVSLFVLQST